ncbi:MAG: hypothetical protein Tsb0017_05960 [Geothermobacteraceae bacterium]
MRWLILMLLLILSGVALAAWDKRNALIDTSQIVSGGPPKDGIPALTDPEFIPGARASFMRPDEQVLGVVANGVAKAYPTRILSWHELVNDRFGGLPVLVSW